MKVFLEYIPLIFFLIVYKLAPRMVELAGYTFEFGGIFSATAVLMILTVLIYGFFLVKDRSLTRTQWIVVIAVLLFGSSTLLFHSENILKWKAPVVNWIIGVIFLASQFMAKQNMAKTMFGQMVTMPEVRWTRLNLGWAFVFILTGSANLFVAFTFPDYWVDFKVFGSFTLLMIATVLQIIYIYPYLESEDDKKEETGERPE